MNGDPGRGYRAAGDGPPPAPPEGERSTDELLAELPDDVARLGDAHGVIRLGPATGGSTRMRRVVHRGGESGASPGR